MSAHEIAADRIAEAGHKAGQSIWLALEDAYSAGMLAKKMRRAFECALEVICEDMPLTEAPLFMASAYEALPIALLSAVERSEIDRNAWDAWDSYVQYHADHCALDDADHYYDMRRDEVAA